jgi:2-polyprenyl-3-methyl-5-hydroxy-6-metoxy-1,4-benzoquinol methylase
MDNIFEDYPEFIDSDPRTSRLNTQTTYNVDANFQFLRHQQCLPEDMVRGKRVLDLGSCVGASGAWVLSLGAEKYVGVELQETFCQKSIDNLQQRFDRNRWEIHQQNVSEFLKNTTEQFDVVIMFGILYQSIYFEELLLNVVKINPEHILVDGMCALIYVDKSVKEKVKDIPLIEYVANQGMVSETEGYKYIFNGSRMNAAALKVFFKSNGYSVADDHTDYIKNLRPLPYQHRYCLNFVKSGPAQLLDFEANYKSTDQKMEVMFKDQTNKNQWSFNTAVSENFETHARQHIPRYDEIINQSVQICRYTFGVASNIKIIDVGCATGETLRRLYAAGFQDLIGVDASEAMLSKVQQSHIAKWIHSEDFPADLGPYNAVLCNWTLHFIQQKRDYLEKIYNGLHSGGVLVLTDKTANSGVELEMYHDIKRANGVTEEDIELKAQSVQNVMFIDPPAWYIKTLEEIGFADIKIINASPCFTTFMAVKR